MKKGKVIAIIFMILLGLISIAFDSWYFYVMKYAPEKVISQTYEIGSQTITKADGSKETKHFIDINLYKNCFEIKFNYVLDENQNAFYSQGVQYALKDNSSLFNFDGKYSKLISEVDNGCVKEKREWLNNAYYFNSSCIYSDKVFDNIDKFNYQSSDDYVNSVKSTNPIDDKSFFKIQIDDELYLMNFRYSDIDFDNDFFINKLVTQLRTSVYGVKVDYNYKVVNNYKVCDIDYFAELLYNSVFGIQESTTFEAIFEFGDLFNYYKYNSKTGQYSENKIETDEYSKLVADVKSYYSIGVTVHSSDLVSSEQSLFKMYKGNANYKTDESFNDYFSGRNLIVLTYKDFDFIAIDESGKYKFRLKDNVRKYYLKYKDSIFISVQIDLDSLIADNITFAGLESHTLDGFKIFSAETIKVIDGNIEKGVIYV